MYDVLKYACLKKGHDYKTLQAGTNVAGLHRDLPAVEFRM